MQESIDLPLSSAVAAPVSLRTPNQRAWARFKRNRLGYWATWLLGLMVLASCGAEFISNDRPLIAVYHGSYYFPVFKNYPEAEFGGDFRTPTDWLDPFITEQFGKDGNWVIFPPNRYGANTVNYFSPNPYPNAPSAENLLGTDDRGRDMVACLLYGFRVSMFFGVVLTAIAMVVGTLIGAIQGYFGGWTDLLGQRLTDIWGSMPQLYMLIIFAAIFQPSLGLLIILLSLFSWIGLSQYMRAEFLRNRTLDFVRAARALGQPTWFIMFRHILPNSLTPLITFLPFQIGGSILLLTSLDFLGLGVPPSTPSLGELFHQGKAELDAWWIGVPTFGLFVLTLLLLQLVGDALRDAYDTRKS